MLVLPTWIARLIIGLKFKNNDSKLSFTNNSMWTTSQNETVIKLRSSFCNVLSSWSVGPFKIEKWKHFPKTLLHGWFSGKKTKITQTKCENAARQKCYLRSTFQSTRNPWATFAPRMIYVQPSCPINLVCFAGTML